MNTPKQLYITDFAVLPLLSCMADYRAPCVYLLQTAVKDPPQYHCCAAGLPGVLRFFEGFFPNIVFKKKTHYCSLRACRRARSSRRTQCNSLYPISSTRCNSPCPISNTQGNSQCPISSTQCNSRCPTSNTQGNSPCQLSNTQCRLCPTSNTQCNSPRRPSRTQRNSPRRPRRASPISSTQRNRVLILLNKYGVVVMGD